MSENGRAKVTAHQRRRKGKANPRFIKSGIAKDTVRNLQSKNQKVKSQSINSASKGAKLLCVSSRKTWKRQTKASRANKRKTVKLSLHQFEDRSQQVQNNETLS
jgi:hypothetical protein